jgi:hypothetical protein
VLPLAAPVPAAVLELQLPVPASAASAAACWSPTLPLAAVAPLLALTSPLLAASDADAPDEDRPPAGSLRIYGRPDRGWLYLAGGIGPMAIDPARAGPASVQACR